MVIASQRPGTTGSTLITAAVSSPLARMPLLANAWKRVVTSGHAPYKNFLRLEIEAFGAAADPLLKQIQSELRSRTYQPEPAYRISVPKSKYATRAFTLLSVPDWVVYNAVVTLIAEAAFPRERRLYDSVRFSNLPLSNASGRPTYFFRQWKRQYAKFNKTSKQHIASGFPFLASIDITSYYDFIDHQLLLDTVRRYLTEVNTLELLQNLLSSWIPGNGSHFGHGIPQGPEASAFLGDLFLMSLDKHMMGRSSTCRYVRYVDDIRVFCRTARRAEAEVIHLEEQIKQLGLVPNSSKVGVTDARRNSDWLKEESSEALTLDNASMNPSKKPRSVRRLQHIIAKPTFMANCAREGNVTKTFLARRSLPKLLPDPQVINRIIEVYDHRHDLHDLFFVYLRECKNNARLARFCQRQLSRVPARDWECANLLEVLDISTGAGRVSPYQGRVIGRYIASGNGLPLAASTAASLLFRRVKPRSLASQLDVLPPQAIYLARWLPPAARLTERKKALHRSVRSRLRALFSASDHRTSFVASYITSTKFPKMVSSLPSPASSYSRIILNTIAHSTIDPSVDEIAPLLRRLFRLNVPTSFDFRKKLDSLPPGLYVKALIHLRLAARYVDTSPTHFVNQIHNFNHLLLHFVLHKGTYTATPVKWQYTFGQIQPGSNPLFQRAFPTITNVFLECSQLRNTNEESHPFDSRHSRFSKLVTYPQRDRLISKQRAAFQEFVAKA